MQYFILLQAPYSIPNVDDYNGEYPLNIVIFLGKFFTGVVSQSYPLDLVKHLAFLTKMKIVQTFKARFDPE